MIEIKPLPTEAVPFLHMSIISISHMTEHDAQILTHPDELPPPDILYADCGGDNGFLFMLPDSHEEMLEQIEAMVDYGLSALLVKNLRVLWASKLKFVLMTPSGENIFPHLHQYEWSK